MADVGILEAAPVEIRGGGLGDTTALLADGIVAAAVAIAHTPAITDLYTDIGVSSLPAYRRRGVVATLGFAPALRRVYVILDSRRPSAS